MSDLDKIYFDATTVNINEQKALWDNRGKGYYGEYLLFSDLYRFVEGQCKILMNLHIPTKNGKTTEIDCLMIHESGIYAFECKHHKGTIYGAFTDDKWTQYFRTSPNNSFSSPVKQNAYHIEALKNMQPGVPIRSFIVFTNDETEVRVTGWENTETVVCKLRDLAYYFRQTSSNNVLSGEKIDELFKKLYPYAQTQQGARSLEEEPAPLVNYLNQIKKDYEAAKGKLQIEIEKSEHEKCEKRVNRIRGIATILCVVCLFLSVLWIELSRRDAAAKVKQSNQERDLAVSERNKAVEAQQHAEQERDEMAKKFKKAEPMNGDDVELADDFLEAYDVKLEMSKDLKDTVLFTGKIRVNAEQYRVKIHNHSTIVVQMKDGSVVEYDQPVNMMFRTLSKPFDPATDLRVQQIHASSVSDIAYIKLANVALEDKTTLREVLSGVEFELYSAQK